MAATQRKRTEGTERRSLFPVRMGIKGPVWSFQERGGGCYWLCCGDPAWCHIWRRSRGRVCPRVMSRIHNGFLLLLLLLNAHLCSGPSDFTSCPCVLPLRPGPDLFHLSLIIPPPPQYEFIGVFRACSWRGAPPVFSGCVHMFPVSCLFPDSSLLDAFPCLS